MITNNPGAVNPNFQPKDPLENKNQFDLSSEAIQRNRQLIENQGQITEPSPVVAQTRQSLGVPVSDKEWALISEAAITSNNPQEELNKYAAAITFAREFDIDVSAAMQNLDSLMQYQLGRKFIPDKNALQAIYESFELGRMTVKRSEIASALRHAHYSGEDITDLVNQMAEMDSMMESKQDHLPRSLLTRMIKIGAQTIPYSIDVGLAGFKGGVATAASVAALATMAGVPLYASGVGAAPALLSTVGIAGAGFVVGRAAFSAERTRELQSGVAYYEMINAGVDKEIAWLLSDVEGVIYGITESFLDQIGGMALSAIGVDTFFSRLASSIAGKAAVNGTLGAVGVGLTRWGLEGLGEGFEEVVQSFTSSAREEITYHLTGVAPDDDRNAIEKAVEEGLAGFVGGLMLGIPVSGVNTFVDYKRAQSINSLATDVPSKSAFVKAMEDVRPEGVSEADWTNAMGKTWERRNVDRSPSVILDEHTAGIELDADKGKTPSGVVRRLKDGSLYTQETDRVTVDTDGAEHHTMKIGDPVTGLRYGTIEYQLRGNSLEIEGVRVREGYEGIRQEALLDLVKQYQGYDITWNPETENLQQIKQQIIESNPRGSEAGMQYYDGITDVSERIKIEREIQEAFPRLNASERALAATLLQLRAEAKGLSFDQYKKQYGDFGRLFGNHLLDDVDLRGRKGATLIQDTESGIKATIYAAKSADFSTFAHEVFHLFRKEMEQVEALQEALSEAASSKELENFIQTNRDIFSGKTFENLSSQQIAEAVLRFGEEWTTLQEEIAARLWESYLHRGKTESAKLNNIFKRFAEWMRKVYQAIRNQVDLSENIIKVFDSLLDSDSPIAEIAREAQLRESKESSKAGRITLFQQAPPVDSDAFRTWFKNSKAIDENGNPLELHRGTAFVNAPEEGSRGYWTFGIDGHVYMTTSPEVASTYTPRKLITSNEMYESLSKKEKTAIDNTTIPSSIKYFIKYEDGKQLLEINRDGSFTGRELQGGRLGADGKYVNLDSDALGTLKRKRKFNNLHIIAGYESVGKDGIFLRTDISDAARNYYGVDSTANIKEALGSLEQHLKRLIYSNYMKVSEGAGIRTLYASIQNPFIVDFDGESSAMPIEIDGKTWGYYRGLQDREAAITAIERHAKENGHDGVILKNIKDIGSESSDFTGYLEKGGSVSDVYIAFDKEQVMQKELYDASTLLFQEATPANSEAFKVWFKDSKVVDDNGNPLVVYHNTTEIFEAFDLAKARQSVELPGFFFSSSPDEWTDMGANQIQAYISIQNPFEGQYSNYNGIRGGSTYDSYQQIRESLIRDGYDGVITKEDGVLEIIAFYPEQIKSINNRGTWDINNFNIYFQEDVELSRHHLELAKESDSWEDFKDKFIIDIGMDFDVDIPSEDQWYIEKFNEAHNINSNITLEADPQVLNARIESEQQKDDYFAEAVSDDNKLKEFLKEMGYAIVDRSYEHGVSDAEEAAERDRLYDLRRRIETEASPYVIAIAIRNTTTREITEAQLKKVRTTMIGGDAIRYYRDLYAATMQDEQLKATVIDERLPNIDDPAFHDIETMSIADRLRLAADIEAEDLKRAILKGEEKFAGEAEKVIKKMDRDIASLEDQIAKLEEDLTNRNRKLSASEREVTELYKKINEARSALEKETKDLRKKADADPKYQIDMTNSYALQTKIDELHEQTKKLRMSDRVKATLKRQEALIELRRTLREKQKLRDDARKIRALKLKRARSIMGKPSDAIDYEYRQKIYQIQSMLDPNFRTNKVNIIDEATGKKMSIDSAAEIISTFSDEELLSTLGERVYNRIKGITKPLNDWSLIELEDVAETVANLRKEGRLIWEAKQEQRRIVAERYQAAITQSLMATGKYKPRPLSQSLEDDQQRRSIKERLRAVLYATWDADRWAQMLDNGHKKDAYELLIRSRRRLQQLEWTNVENRVQPVVDLMKQLKISPDELYKNIEISLSGMESHNVSISYLMYAYLSQFNKQNRDAVAYGNLVSIAEKESFNNDHDLVKNVGDVRYNELIAIAEEQLDAKNKNSPYMQIVEAIRKDLNDQAPRINEIAIREYNTPMRTLENYLPNHRLGATGLELSESILDDLYDRNAGAMPTSVEKGFMRDRINIKPANQREVNMDLFGVWDKSMRQHEHMIAFAEYGRMLNRVFKVKTDGVRLLRDTITQTYGYSMMNNLDNYINEAVNPASFRRVEGGDKLLRALRGNLGAAYLAWKFSGLVLQQITSPMPFTADISAPRLFMAYKDIMLHPVKTWEFIIERSKMMKNRSMNPIIQLILERSQERTTSKLSKLNKQQQEIGSLGLTWVDRFSVMGGWLAAYQQELEKLQQNLDLSDARREILASEYADEVVLRTQPTGDPLELSPMFKMGGEAMKIITQFQVSLNVIWKNLTYDIPTMVKNHEYVRAIGQVTGYVLAGAILGAVAEGHKPDDDAKKKALNWLYWSTTQFSEAVPLISNQVDELMNSAITGEKPHYFGNDIYPAATSIISGLTDITQKNYLRALKRLSEGFGYSIGLPVSGVKQAIRATKEGPGATLGRRKE